MFIFNNSSFFKDKVFTDVFSSRDNNSDDSFGNVSYDSKLQKFLTFWSVVRLELSHRKLHQPSLLIGLLPSINIQPDFVLTAIGAPSHPSRNSLCNKRSAWSVPVNMATFKYFSWGNSIPLKCENLCLILDVSYLLKDISRLFTSHADSFDESFIADELVLTKMMAESILFGFHKALVTADCCWLPSRCNLSAISFLKKLCLIHISRVHLFLLKEVHLIILSVWLAKRCDFLQFVYVRFLLFHLWFGCFCVMTVSCMMVVTVTANALGGIATK